MDKAINKISNRILLNIFIFLLDQVSKLILLEKDHIDYILHTKDNPHMYKDKALLHTLKNLPKQL